MLRLVVKNKPIDNYFLGNKFLGNHLCLGIEKADYTYGTLYNDAEDTNGILSNFNKQEESHNGYFVPNFTFPSDFGTSYEFLFCAKVDEPLDNYLWFISNNNGFNSYIGPHITMDGPNPIAKDNALSLGFGDELDLTKKLFFKLTFNGLDTYTLSVADEPEFKNAKTKSYVNAFLLPSSPIAFGSKFGAEPMNGYIDLHYCYYKENNHLVWKGTGVDASYTLTLNTNIDDCNVVFHVNGEDLEPTSSTANSYSLTTKFKGEIGYTISKEGYDTRTDSIPFLTSDTNIDVNMILTTHYFTINTNVEDCNVVFHVNGQDLTPTSSTSKSYTLATKWYDEFTYTVSKEDYEIINGTVDSLHEDKSVDVELILTTLNLIINTNVADCSVVFHVNGEDLTPTYVESNKYTLSTQWKGEIGYTVSKDDYVTQNGSVFHMLEDTNVDIELDLITLNLTLNTNVSDCTVVFHVNGEDLAPTSVVGNRYNLATKWKGDISYTVSKNDYVTVSNTITRLYEDKVIDVNLVLVSYTLTLNTNVADCNVVFTYNGEDHEPTTSSDNTYTLTTNYRGEITYTVSKEGYYTISNKITSLISDATIDLTLILITYTLTLNTNVANCTVVFTYDGEEHEPTSSTDKSYSITVKENTAIDYTVSKEDYVTVSDSIEALVEDTEVDVEMIHVAHDLTLKTNVNDCTVVFTYDGEEHEPTTSTDNTYTLTTNYRGEITYTVSKEEYITVTDSIDSLTEDTEVEVEMILANHDITFDITPSDADIRYSINDGLFRHLTGTVLTAPHNSKVHYIISKKDYIDVDETINSLIEDTTVTKTLVLTTYNLTLNTNVEDCNVVFTFDGQDHEPTSSTSNSYTLTTQYKGQITYTVSKEDYVTVTDTVAKLVQDTNIDVELTPASHTLTLNTNVEDCTVVFHVNGGDLAPTSSTSNSYSLTTGWTGEIGYTVSKTDYITVEDSIDSLNEDKSVNITLEPKIYIQQIYDANGNLVNIDDLDVITEKQFNNAYNYNMKLSGELKHFPSTEVKIDGLRYAFEYCTNLTGSVSFPSLTTIDSYGLGYAFCNCTNLTGSVSFPALTTIGQFGLSYAFKGCTNLTGSVSFPNLTTVGILGLSSAFKDCTNLTEVHFKKSMSSNSQCTASNMGCTNATVYFDLP